jgi:hypothetical protein
MMQLRMAWLRNRVGLVVASLGVVALAALYASLLILPDEPDEVGDRFYAQLQCVGAVILSEVDVGAVVLFDDVSPDIDPEWQQRLIELTFPERSVTTIAESADVRISLRRVEPGRGCDGIEVGVAPS